MNVSITLTPVDLLMIALGLGMLACMALAGVAVLPKR
jgi:hypothetical protein